MSRFAPAVHIHLRICMGKIFQVSQTRQISRSGDFKVFLVSQYKAQSQPWLVPHCFVDCIHDPVNQGDPKRFIDLAKNNKCIPKRI